MRIFQMSENVKTDDIVTTVTTTTKGGKAKRKVVSLKDFLTAWQRSNSITEVADILSLKPLTVYIRGNKLRKEFKLKGIELKKLSNTSHKATQDDVIAFLRKEGLLAN